MELASTRLQAYSQRVGCKIFWHLHLVGVYAPQLGRQEMGEPSGLTARRKGTSGCVFEDGDYVSARIQVTAASQRPL